MDLKERYIYAVVSKLPEKQRDEIAKEVNILIEDMMDGIDGENDAVKLEHVLLELGEPSKLADKYRGEERFLIGPKYFNNYIYTLKIVMITVLIVSSISAIVGIFVDNTHEAITSYFGFLFSGAVQAFAWVTIIFAIFEYTKVDLNYKEEKWNPKKLPAVPHEKAKISRGETIFGIIFATAFLVLMYSELFGVIIPKKDDGFVLIPIFNYDNISYFKVTFVILSLIGIAKEVFKLIFNRWNLQLSIINTVLTVVSTIIFVIVFSNYDIWNLNLTTDIAKALDISVDKIRFEYKKLIDLVVVIGIIGAVVDIIITMYKGTKYNNK